MKRVTTNILMILALLVGSIATAQAASETWAQVAAQTSDGLERSLEIYKGGDIEGAVKAVDEAYFGPFERDGMEAAIRLSISGQRAFEHEYVFRQIKVAYKAKKPPGEVALLISELSGMLDEDAGVMDGSGGSTTSLFFSSFIIILREGFEAIFIVSALVTYLSRSGHKEKVRVIYSGVLIALLASLATAFILSSLIQMSGARQEVIEGGTMLLATIVLFYVSFWLLGKSQAQAWQGYIQDKVKSSLTRGSMIALWSVAFLAVYREGAETVLFYTALAGRSSQSQAIPALGAGFILGSIALAGVYAAIRYTSLKLPMRSFFILSGNLLYLMAVIFAGQGISELQAAGVVGSTSISGLPAITPLGVYPTLETLAPQMLLIVLYAGTFIYKNLSGAGKSKKGSVTQEGIQKKEYIK